MNHTWYDPLEWSDAWCDPSECSVCGLKHVPKIMRLMSDDIVRVFCVDCLDKKNAKEAIPAEADRAAAVANECRDRLAMYGMS